MITISPGSVANGIVGAAYVAGLTVDSLNNPVWSLLSGSLPPGLQFSDGSTIVPPVAQGDNRRYIHGTPTTPGTYIFTVGVIDDTPEEDTQEYTIEITEPVCNTFIDCDNQSLSTKDILRLLIQPDTDGCPALNTIRN